VPVRRRFPSTWKMGRPSARRRRAVEASLVGGSRLAGQLESTQRDYTNLTIRGAPGIPASGWTRALRGGEPAAGEWLAGGNGYGAMPDEPDRWRIFGPSDGIFLERTSRGQEN
jgi:hypothetical protein